MMISAAFFIVSMLGFQYPNDDDVMRVCGSYAQSIWRESLEQPDLIDINNDGKPETLGSKWCGQNRECEAFLGIDGIEINLRPVFFEKKDYPDTFAQPFVMNERVFIGHISLSKRKMPVYVSLVDPKNDEYVLCTFDGQVQKEPDRRSRICSAVVYGWETFIYWQVRSPTSFNEADLGLRYTSVLGEGVVDFDNDKIPERLVLLSHSSGGNYPCTTEYFDLLDSVRNEVTQSSKRTLLFELQGLRFENQRPIPKCGAGKFFSTTRQPDVIYLERDALPFDEHAIRRVKDGETETICKIIDGTSGSWIREIYPHGRP